jgi:hypothetical protein
MSRQTTDQLYIDLGYKTPEEFYVYVADAESSMSAVSSVECSASKIALADCVMQAEFVQVAFGSRTTDIDLFAFSQAAIAVQVDRIRDNNIQATVSFDIAVDYSRVRFIDSAESALFSFDLVNDRSRAFQMETQAAFSLAATIDDLTKEAVANLSSESNSVCIIGSTVNYAANLSAHSSVFVSRNVGTDRPKTITGSFTSNELINAATRISDLRSLNSDNWFYETHFRITSSSFPDSFDSKEIVYIPLGTINGVPAAITVTLSWRSATGYVLNFSGPGNTTASQIPLNGGTIGISFTGGQRLAFYVDGVRVGLNTNVNTTNWIIPKTQTVRFARDYPFTVAGKTFTGFTDFAWLTLENKTTSGAASYSLSTPVNTVDTVFLYSFNGNGNDSTALTFTGNSVLASTSTVAAALSGPVKYSADIVSVTSLTAAINNIQGIDLTAFSDAALSATALRIQSSTADAVSQFAQTTNAVIQAHAESAIAGQFAQVAVNTRILDNTIATESIATQLSAVARLAGLFADDLTEFNIDIEAVKTAQGTADILSAFSTSAVNDRIRDTDSSAASEFGLAVDGNAVIIAECNSAAEFSVIADVEQFIGVIANVTCSASMLVQGSNAGKIESSMFDAATLNCSVTQLFGFDVLFSTESSAAVTAVKITDSTADTNSEFNLAAQGLSNKDVTAYFTSIASELIAVVKIGDFLVDCNSEFTLTADVDQFIGVVQNANAEFALTANAGFRVNAESNLESVVTVTADVTRLVEAVISITSAMQFTAGVREIFIQEIVYVIPAEIWTYEIDSETRRYSITGETNTYII